MSDAFSALDRKWRCSYVNGAPEQIGRPAREQMLQRSVWICFHTQFESALRGAINDGATVRFDEYCEHLDAWFGDMGHPSSAGVTVYVRGITERKRVGEALRQVESADRNVLKSITDALVAVDHKWDYTYINERALGERDRCDFSCCCVVRECEQRTGREACFTCGMLANKRRI